MTNRIPSKNWSPVPTYMLGGYVWYLWNTSKALAEKGQGDHRIKHRRYHDICLNTIIT